MRLTKIPETVITVNYYNKDQLNLINIVFKNGSKTTYLEPNSKEDLKLLQEHLASNK
jgi:hypothetical protein